MPNNSYSSRLLAFIGNLPHFAPLRDEDGELIAVVRITDGAKYSRPSLENENALDEGRLLASWPGAYDIQVSVAGSTIAEIACSNAVDYWYSLSETFDKEQTLRDLISHLNWKTTGESWTALPQPAQVSFYSRMRDKALERGSWLMLSELARWALRSHGL